MSDQLIVERGGLEKKEKGELQAIISALGGSASARARKSDLIDQIMELSGATDLMSPPTGDSIEAAPAEGRLDFGADGDTANGNDGGPADDAPADELDFDDDGDDADEGDDADDPEARADDDVDDHDDDDDDDDEVDDEAPEAPVAVSTRPESREREGRDSRDARRGDGGGQGRNHDRNNRNDRNHDRGGNRQVGGHPVGPDGEPLADWEVAVSDQGGQNRNDRNREQGDGDDIESGNRRNRRRGRGRGRERDEVAFETIPTEPFPVAGVLDLRDEGYGFLRVDGCLPSKDDVYVSVKQVRQYGLRKGDLLTGLSRPANRNEKNPGFHQIDTVNGVPVEEGASRVRFDDLTPVHPDQPLRLTAPLEGDDDGDGGPTEPSLTARIVDLVAPIGKGQRVLVTAPPRAGKTMVLKDLARAIEAGNPEVLLIVLLLDERPEEVTDMRRQLVNGEVIASTFDRPPEEHCSVADLTLERAKRLVEAGEDVCIIVDGLTRLGRAHNLSNAPTGRSVAGGVDAGALFPPKRFFGAARNLEEGGSLTIVATVLANTGSRMDEAIAEEMKGTDNCLIALDRRLADKRLFPAIDVLASSTRHDELLRDDEAGAERVWELRRQLAAAAGPDGDPAVVMEDLRARLAGAVTNADLLGALAH